MSFAFNLGDVPRNWERGQELVVYEAHGRHGLGSLLPKDAKPNQWPVYYLGNQGVAVQAWLEWWEQ